MAHFDLNQYQTVQERIDLFWEKYPGGRFDLQIVNLTETQVIIRAQVWTDKTEEYPTTVDFAEERIGTSPVNKISHVENCSTSALGRAISALGNEFSPKGKRPSREEMEKVARGVPSRDWLAEAGELAKNKDIDALRLLYSEAKTAKASVEILDWVKMTAESMK
jgi:hypothetical protein